LFRADEDGIALMWLSPVRPTRPSHSLLLSARRVMLIAASFLFVQVSSPSKITHQHSLLAESQKKKIVDTKLWTEEPGQQVGTRLSDITMFTYVPLFFKFHPLCTVGDPLYNVCKYDAD